MAVYLVYRDTATDKFKIPYEIGGFIVNGASSGAALTQAAVCASRYCGPNEAALVANWSTILLGSSDIGAGVANAVITGDVRIPGLALRGGGMSIA